MMENVMIRKMEFSEKPRVQEIFESVFQETFSGPVPEYDSAVRGEQIYVAYHSGLIAGFASVWEPDAFIHFLFVDPFFRRKGIGQALVRALSKNSGRHLTLKCLVKNSEAMAFYLATGWRSVDTGICEDGPYSLLRYAPPKDQICPQTKE